MELALDKKNMFLVTDVNIGWLCSTRHWRYHNNAKKVKKNFFFLLSKYKCLEKYSISEKYYSIVIESICTYCAAIECTQSYCAGVK